jgi:hypothetical protein
MGSYSCARVAPPNSLLFISDPNGGVGPEYVKGKLVLATSTCISVGCRAFIDGETQVFLGSASELDPGRPPAFDGMIETPNRKVVVSTVEHETILEILVPGTRTHVRIWVDHPTEPDNVIIGVE